MDAPYDELERKLASIHELLVRGDGKTALLLLEEGMAEFAKLKEDRYVMQMVFANRVVNSSTPPPLS